MLFWKWIFFICVFLFFYNYAGYAIIVSLINKLRPKFKTIIPPENYFPSVSFIVAAYNEATIIEKKIQNSLRQAYPLNQVEFIFITDGSTDESMSIIRRYPQVKLMHEAARKGKSAALNRAALTAQNEILIISDANTFLNSNAIKYITSHYYDKLTGGVAGEKRVIDSPDDNENIGGSEGLYWKYESFLKKIDSDFYSVVGAAGEIFSVRKDLFESIPESAILDDFILSLKTAEKGYRIVYEPRAYAMEFASASLKDEKKRKIRIAAGGFQSIQILSSLLKFWKNPRLSFLYISHRVLRWAVSPLCLILILIANIFIVIQQNNFFYSACIILQVIFYITAFLSNYIPSNSKLKPLKSAGYFVFMNVAVLQGFMRFISNKQASTWEKVSRSSAALEVE